MVGNFPTVRERLDQILRYGLPYVVRTGNTIASKSGTEIQGGGTIVYNGSKSNRGISTNKTLVGLLDGHIPEFVLGICGVPQELTNQGKFWISKSYADAIINAMGVESFSKDKIVSGELLKSEALECHAFYDPTADTTHYFVLPKRVNE